MDTPYGRSAGIRTRGLLDPNQARYQTSPHPDKPFYYTCIVGKCQVGKREKLGYIPWRDAIEIE